MSGSAVPMFLSSDFGLNLVWGTKYFLAERERCCRNAGRSHFEKFGDEHPQSSVYRGSRSTSQSVSALASCPAPAA